MHKQRQHDEPGPRPAAVKPRRVGQNSSAQVGQYSWTQPDDPTYSQMYAGKLRVEIEQVVAAMEALRETLDQPPTHPDPDHEK